jgi:hypothetical protein
MAQARQVSGRGDPAGYDKLLWFLAREHERRGHDQKALAALRKIERFGYWQLDNGDYSRVLSAQAMIRFRNGEGGRARGLADRALRLNSRNEIARRLLAALRTSGPADGGRWPGRDEP